MWPQPGSLAAERSITGTTGGVLISLDLLIGLYPCLFPGCYHHTEVRQHGNIYRSLVKGLWEFYYFRDIFFHLTLLQNEVNKYQSQHVSSTCHFLFHFNLESRALRGAHHEMEKPGVLSHWMNPASLSSRQPEGNFT